MQVKPKPRKVDHEKRSPRKGVSQSKKEPDVTGGLETIGEEKRDFNVMNALEKRLKFVELNE